MMATNDSEIIVRQIGTLERMRTECLRRAGDSIYRADLIKLSEQVGALSTAVELMRNVSACLDCRLLTNGKIKSK